MFRKYLSNSHWQYFICESIVLISYYTIYGVRNDLEISSLSDVIDME